MFCTVLILLFKYTHSVGCSCRFVEFEAKFNSDYLLLDIHHFDNRRHTRKRCKENSQNSGTRALIKTPVG